MQIIQTASFTAWFIVKIFFIIGLAIYSVFAFVVIRQVQIMTETIKLKFELPIKALALIHFIFALGLLIFALVIL